MSGKLATDAGIIGSEADVTGVVLAAMDQADSPRLRGMAAS